MGPDIKQNKSLHRVKKPAGKINKENQGVKERRIINSLPLTSKLINKYKRTRKETNTHLENSHSPSQIKAQQRRISETNRGRTQPQARRREQRTHISQPQELHLQQNTRKKPNPPLKTEMLCLYL